MGVVGLCVPPHPGYTSFHMIVLLPVRGLCSNAAGHLLILELSSVLGEGCELKSVETCPNRIEAVSVRPRLDSAGEEQLD